MSKEKRTELAGRLRDAAKQSDPIARAVVELIKLTGEGLKQSLVDTDGEDMLRLQGAARQLDKLYRELTTAPPSITQE